MYYGEKSAQSLNELSFLSYQIGFPLDGHWFEVFNSDLYDNWVNPNVVGNGGSVHATGQGFDGLPASAHITLPANSILVFTRDEGDQV